MSPLLEAGVLIALFLMVLASYKFIFGINNHLVSELNKLRVEIADRLARIETVLKIKEKR